MFPLSSGALRDWLGSQSKVRPGNPRVCRRLTNPLEEADVDPSRRASLARPPARRICENGPKDRLALRGLQPQTKNFGLWVKKRASPAVAPPEYSERQEHEEKPFHAAGFDGDQSRSCNYRIHELNRLLDGLRVLLRNKEAKRRPVGKRLGTRRRTPRQPPALVQMIPFPRLSASQASPAPTPP